MTCVVAIKDGNSVYMGSDSCVMSGNHLERLKERKICQKGPYLIGNAGTWRSVQVLQFANLPLAPKCNLLRFMCTDFVDAVRKAFKDAGVLEVSKEDTTESGNTSALIAVHGRVFMMGTGFSICEMPEHFTAIGSGKYYAFGSLETSRGNGMAPEDRVKVALKVASKYADGVRGPYHVKKMEWS